MFQSVRRFFAQPQVREFLLWCLPALLVGLALRAVLLAQLPYAIYHDDSGDLLITPQTLLTDHEWQIHGKKTFLVPTTITIFALLKTPILLALPLLQHLAGLVLILMVGLLCRLWFAHWRWFILPVTLIVAINPAILWYEHLLMAETAFVFCTVMVALAGTLYALAQTRGRFAFLCLALFLEAGSRPEGKLLFGFAFFLLVLMHWGAWRLLSVRFALLFVLAVGTHFLTLTGQAGLLLYTSVARMTPSNLRCAPGFDPYIAQIRAELKRRWDEDLSFPRVADRRLIAGAVAEYIHDNAKKKTHTAGHEETDALCLKIAKETCVRNFFNLPEYFYQKFRNTTREPTFGLLDRNWVFDRQKQAYIGNKKTVEKIRYEITGEDVMPEDAAVEAFLHKHYQVIPWFNTLGTTWNEAINYFRLPDERRVTTRVYIIRRLPIIYLVALAGLLVMLFRRGTLHRYHIAWGLTLLALFYTIILTANLRGRFRFFLEPFWYLYIGLLVDSLAFWLVRRPRPVEARADEPVSPAVSLSRPA